MMKAVNLRAGLVSAGVGLLIAGLAFAQQSQTDRNDGDQSRGSGSRQPSVVQQDRSSAAQSGRATSQSSDQRNQTPGLSGTATHAANGGQGREVEQYLTACLLADNQAEVELSQVAQQHATNNEVKEFAQMMVRDHQKMIQQLQQLSGAAAGTQSGQSSANESTRSSASTATSRSADTTATSTPGSNAASDSGSSASPGGGSALNSLGPGGATAAQATTGGSAVQQLMQIDRQIVERKSQATRQELQQKSGADFDKGFVSTAINAHIHAIAALEVIGKHGQGQLAQLAQQSRPTVQQHLEHAEQLMKTLEREGGSSTTASRSTGSRSER